MPYPPEKVFRPLNNWGHVNKMMVVVFFQYVPQVYSDKGNLSSLQVSTPFGRTQILPVSQTKKNTCVPLLFMLHFILNDVQK